MRKNEFFYVSKNDFIFLGRKQAVIAWLLRTTTPSIVTWTLRIFQSVLIKTKKESRMFLSLSLRWIPFSFANALFLFIMASTSKVLEMYQSETVVTKEWGR